MYYQTIAAILRVAKYAFTQTRSQPRNPPRRAWTGSLGSACSEPRGLARSFEQLDDAVNEPLSRLDCGYRLRKRHGPVRPDLVISNGLEIISLRQETRQLNARCAVHSSPAGKIGREHRGAFWAPYR